MHAAANAFDRLHRAQLELLSRFFMTSDLINIAKERCFGWHTSFNLANRGAATLTCSNTAFQFQSAHTHTQCSTLIAFLQNGDRNEDKGRAEERKLLFTFRTNCYKIFKNHASSSRGNMQREMKERSRVEGNFYFHAESKMKCKDFHRHAGFLDGFLNMHTEHQFYTCVCVCVRVSRELRPITMLQHGGQ